MQGSTQLLKSRVDSTPTPVGYFGGVFQTSFTTLWTPNQSRHENENLQAVCAVYYPNDFVLLVDLGLHNAGWKFARTETVFELHEIIGSRAQFCWARDIDTVEVIRPTANPNGKSLADRIHADGPQRADSERLIQLLDDIFQLIGAKTYSEIDLLMRSLEFSRSAPEYLVGILRASSKEARHIPYWADFLSSVKAELSVRKLDPAKILIGLL